MDLVQQGVEGELLPGWKSWYMTSSPCIRVAHSAPMPAIFASNAAVRALNRRRGLV
jgi:hypothetical protein